MKAPRLLKKIFNIREDYIKSIAGQNFPEKDKQNLEKFINEIKSNRGKLISIGTATCSELAREYVERFDAAQKGVYATGYFEDYEFYQNFSHHFIIHYRCHKRIEEKDL